MQFSTSFRRFAAAAFHGTKKPQNALYILCFRAEYATI